MKTLKITILGAAMIAITACGGPAETGEVTIEDGTTVEITRTEVKSETVLSAERTASSLKEQGEKLVGDAENKASELKDLGETIKVKTAENAQRLKAEGVIDDNSADMMKDAAENRANDLEATAKEIVTDAKDQAKAMEETGEKMMEEVKKVKDD